MVAPRVFISYSHDSPEHKERVQALAVRLRQDDVDCSIDQDEQSPPEGWPLWCERRVTKSTYVLVVCTETYRRRFQGEEAPRQGLGGTWEALFIRQELYNAQGENTKFIPIIFSPEYAQFIPPLLQSATHYLLAGDYDLLCRRLTTRAVKPEHRTAGAGERKRGFEPLCQVRRRKNVFFTGRVEVLADLRETLEKQGAAALVGRGGVGKTQTAIEYAYRYRDIYRAVFWADAESRETLLADFVSIAGMLNLPSAQAQEQQQAIAGVKRWLEGNPGWLLILDNADELPLIEAFLPNAVNGHVLLTTRDRAATALAERIGMRDMPPEEGALLLLRRAGVIAKDALFSDAAEADQRLALQLSKELGGLPLALDQAGAFIEETRRSLSEFAELYASQKARLLAKRSTLGEHPSVTVTFSLAFEKVAENSAAAADLIRLCAFLAPDAIPEEIFTAGASALGENLSAAVTDEFSFAEITGEAGRLSLLDRDPATRTFNIHRLVQIVIKAGMPAADQRIWAERAVRATEEAFPRVEYANWALCQRLIAHAQTCASLIKEWDFGFAEAARLLNQAAMYLAARALFADAEPLYQRSLAIREVALGPDHPHVAVSLNNLASLYADQGKYAEAESLYQRSLAVYEKALAPDYPDMATSLNNLAELYRHQGKYAEAEPLYQRSLAIKEMALGPDHPDVARSLNNLALLYSHQGKYGDAEPLYQRSLAIWERALGPDDPDVAASLNNLALLCDEQGRYAEAEPLYQRSLAISEKALGPDHPDVGATLNNLAMLYFKQGKYAEAEPLYQRSLGICEKALGPDHPDVAASVNNLAVLYRHQGKYVEAEPLYQRSLAIRERALGTEHPDVAESLNNLATLYYKQEKYAEAEPLLQRSLGLCEKVLGPDHPRTSLARTNLDALRTRTSR